MGWVCWDFKQQTSLRGCKARLDNELILCIMNKFGEYKTSFEVMI